MSDPAAQDQEIVEAIARLSSRFDMAYWRRCDEEGRFPDAFADAMAAAGWLGVAMPESVGGAGLGLRAAAIVMREVGRMGAAATSAIHVNLFGAFPIVVHGDDDQRARLLEPIRRGEVRLCFGVTEPDAGLETTAIRTVARREGDRYLISGRKVWTSTAQRADRVLILARTTAREKAQRASQGLSVFCARLDRRHVEIREIPKMARAAVDSNEVVFEDLPVSARDRIGAEGDGLRVMFSGLNAERVLVAASAVGAARAVLECAARYANERVVFGRPIGANQGVQHPLAHAWAQVHAAELAMLHAADLWDADRPCGVEATAAKYLAAEAGHLAAERAVRAHGGYGFAREYHVERYFRESVLALLAPVSQELALCHIAERALGLPKSY